MSMRPYVRFFLLAALLLALAGCLSVFYVKPPKLMQGQLPPPSHAIWDSLLRQYASDDGRVNYRGFLEDRDRLDTYLALLDQHAPAPGWSRADSLAYWINAYNAFTIRVILDHYPLKSIRELNDINLIATIWDKPLFRIGGEPISLGQIEHRILREDFHEPRIHFAINCASVSCPVLRSEAYTAQQIESQLEDQTRRFFADSTRNHFTPEKAELSSILLWFRGDFTREGSLIDFVNRYAPVTLPPDAKVSHIDYDWRLNE
ncbi:MAG: DUF547 domain-containing protein [Bacteroidetes bacterium]|nr:MAG: DUF547 domain-containing protein [Bacteroidota bacterium]